MGTEPVLMELGQAASMIFGAITIIGVFILMTGGIVWLWLKIGKWLSRYVHRASTEFREAFQQVNKKGK